MKKVDNDNGKQAAKVVPVEIHITALGTEISVNSNSQDPKMVMTVLVRAVEIMVAQYDIKKPDVRLIQEIPLVVPAGRF